MHNRCRYRYRSYHRPCRKTQREIDRPDRRDKKKPAHKRSLFLISGEKLSFVRGFLLWERHDGRPQRHDDPTAEAWRHDSRPHAETRARPVQANMPPAEGRPRCSGTNTGAASRRPETLCPALRHALYHGKNGAVAHMELVTRMQRRHSIPLQLILDTIGTIYHKRSIR